MSPELLLKHFDQISDTPDAVPRLRRFVLGLAVRGKLVKQNPEDEPAAELLKRIEAEKAKRVQEGIIKKRETLPSIETNEVPFNVPKGWQFVRLGNAIELINGRAFKPSEWGNSGLPIIRIQNLNDSNAPFNYCDFPVPERFHVKIGDFLISWSGTPGTSFGAHIWDRGPAILNQHIFKAKLIGDSFLLPFLKLAINSRLLELIDQAHGGVGLQHITKPKLERLPLTLPPLAEQHRIVAKADELMALCDELEAAQTKRERRRDRLVVATLHCLNNGDSDSETSERLPFEESARFYFKHLPRLTGRPEHIQLLRQSILNLAVRGKLVEQNPEDEPAAELLKIATESVEVPFELPNKWGSARAGTLLNIQYGKARPAKDRNDQGRVPVYGSNGVVGYCEEALSEESAIIIGRKGSAGALNLCYGPSWTTDVAYFLIPPNFLNIRYLFFILQTLDLGRLGKGVKPGLSRTEAYELPMAVPPLAEQQRIVAKVDELMALCDELETRITTNATTRRQLLEASLHEAI